MRDTSVPACLIVLILWILFCFYAENPYGRKQAAKAAITTQRAAKISADKTFGVRVRPYRKEKRS